jgi:IS30 family transposase
MVAVLPIAPMDADRQAWESALRPKRCLLTVNRKLRNIVASKLILDWSPEQISGWLKTQFPDDESMRVSHETIYSPRLAGDISAKGRSVLERLASPDFEASLSRARQSLLTAMS